MEHFTLSRQQTSIRVKTGRESSVPLYHGQQMHRNFSHKKDWTCTFTGAFNVIWPCYGGEASNRRVSQMRVPLAACHELALGYDRLTMVLYVWGHKTQHLLFHAPCTRIMIFWHIILVIHPKDVVSNHQPHDCLLNRLFKARVKENIKAPRHWLCEGMSTVTGEFPAQRASNAENASIWWRHHVITN